MTEPLTSRQVEAIAANEARFRASVEVDELRDELLQRDERRKTASALYVYLLMLAGLYFLFSLVIDREPKP
jgi:hypothetical protein